MEFRSWFDQNKSNGNWFRNLEKQYPEMFKVLDEWVEGVPGEKAFLFLANTKLKPVCHCGQPVKFYSGKGFAKRCSTACAANSTALIRSETLKNKSSDEKAKIHLKAKITNCEKYGEKYATHRAKSRTLETLAKTELARKIAMVEKYGVTNPGELEEVHLKRKEAYALRSKDQRERTREQTHNTRIVNGTSLPNDHPTVMGTLKQYTRRVRYLTNKNVALVEELSKSRSMSLHIDHQYSIFDGFKHQVPPQKIAHLANLRLLSATENSSKNLKSSITLKELNSRISNHLK